MRVRRRSLEHKRIRARQTSTINIGTTNLSPIFVAVKFLLLLCAVHCQCMSMSSSSSSSFALTALPPLVYTIAGSDSGGGAGIQADLHAIHAFGCHGCSAITCLTAQNSVGVSAVHAPPISFLDAQLEALATDLPPTAIKIGMLGTAEVVLQVASFLKKLRAKNKNKKIWIVLDPVMISTSGARLIDEAAVDAMVKHLFPLVDVVTPNKAEAEALLALENHRTLGTCADVEQAARDLIAMGCSAVLIKGGHLAQSSTHAEDYLLSSVEAAPEGTATPEPRLCDEARGIWMRTDRFDSQNTHGTGCTLSSAIAAALALGERERTNENNNKSCGVGAMNSIHLADACCLAKAYVTAGIASSVQLGQGPGPVAQTTFPSSAEHFPSIIVRHPDAGEKILTPSPAFVTMKAAACQRSSSSGQNDNSNSAPAAATTTRRPTLGRILPIVDSVEWVERLCKIPGVTDIQLRIKDKTDPTEILSMVQKCQHYCQQQQNDATESVDGGVRLWINDYWQAAVEAGCFGVHLGQEDLLKCIEAGGLEVLRKRNMALGISTHSFAELAAALGIEPTYISLGPVFSTDSKNVAFDPQGLSTVQKWRQLIPSNVPLVAIGGIGSADRAQQVGSAGADCVAVIGAVTKASDAAAAVETLNQAMKKNGV